jgi:hypothetical protein
MPRGVVDLFACWIGFFVEVEQYYMEDSSVLPYVVYLEEEKNDWSF